MTRVPARAVKAIMGEVGGVLVKYFEKIPLLQFLTLSLVKNSAKVLKSLSPRKGGDKAGRDPWKNLSTRAAPD
jgi:hypothetical protein